MRSRSTPSTYSRYRNAYRYWVYKCNYCKKTFRKPQAVGGHQNAHRRLSGGLKREKNRSLELTPRRMHEPKPTRRPLLQHGVAPELDHGFEHGFGPEFNHLGFGGPHVSPPYNFMQAYGDRVEDLYGGDLRNVVDHRKQSEETVTWAPFTLINGDDDGVNSSELDLTLRL